MLSKQWIGKKAEDIAWEFLKTQGYQLIARNYRSSFGEIDLIVKNADTLAFVEVRSRNTDKYGGSLASITAKKQEKIQKTAMSFLKKQFDTEQIACRFDIIALKHCGTSFTITDWIKNAF